MAKMKKKKNLQKKNNKQKQDEQSIRYRVETLVIRMLKEFSEDLNYIKKTQAEMKDI